MVRNFSICFVIGLFLFLPQDGKTVGQQMLLMNNCHIDTDKHATCLEYPIIIKLEIQLSKAVYHRLQRNVGDTGDKY